MLAMIAAVHSHKTGSMTQGFVRHSDMFRIENRRLPVASCKRVRTFGGYVDLDYTSVFIKISQTAAPNLLDVLASGVSFATFRLIVLSLLISLATLLNPSVCGPLKFAAAFSSIVIFC